MTSRHHRYAVPPTLAPSASPAFVTLRYGTVSPQGTFGQGGYGFKASEKLSKVRGKDFRHEKTKKKRGSYRGGEISMNSYSVKFDDSD